jgi:AcrR family transcriptional regulator
MDLRDAPDAAVSIKTPIQTVRRRRTQAERRATTRAALLEACVDCLLEYGYTSLTTAAVVRRAGVSRGAQAHHFSTKAELVVAALRHLTDGLAAEVADRPTLPTTEPGQDPVQTPRGLLDLLWTVHSDRVFPALMELWVAARTDDELRTTLAEFERDLTRQIVGYCQRRLPGLAERPDFRSLLATVLAGLRGLALVGFLGREGELDRMWPGVCTQLLTLLEGPVSG